MSEIEIRVLKRHYYKREKKIFDCEQTKTTRTIKPIERGPFETGNHCTKGGTQKLSIFSFFVSLLSSLRGVFFDKCAKFLS